MHTPIERLLQERRVVETGPDPEDDVDHPLGDAHGCDVLYTRSRSAVVVGAQGARAGAPACRAGHLAKAGPPRCRARVPIALLGRDVVAGVSDDLSRNLRA